MESLRQRQFLIKFSGSEIRLIIMSFTSSAALMHIVGVCTSHRVIEYYAAQECILHILLRFVTQLDSSNDSIFFLVDNICGVT